MAESLALIRRWAAPEDPSGFGGVSFPISGALGPGCCASKVIFYCDCLSVLHRLEALLLLHRAGNVRYHDLLLANLIIRVVNRQGWEVEFVHVYSHVGVWINEVVDNVNLGRLAASRLE